MSKKIKVFLFINEIDEFCPLKLTPDTLETLRWCQNHGLIDDKSEIIVPDEMETESISSNIDVNTQIIKVIRINRNSYEKPIIRLALTQEQLDCVKYLIEEGAFKNEVKWIFPDEEDYISFS